MKLRYDPKSVLLFTVLRIAVMMFSTVSKENPTPRVPLKQQRSLISQIMTGLRLGDVSGLVDLVAQQYP